MGDIEFKWNEEKNEWLKLKRRLSFEAFVRVAEELGVIADIQHPTKPNQRIFVAEIDQYICAVPYIRDERTVFLKTIYHSRTLNKKYGKTHEQS